MKIWKPCFQKELPKNYPPPRRHPLRPRGRDIPRRSEARN